MRVCASNMADGKALEKTIETVQLSCLPSYPGAISWSLDDRVSVITDKCVYILTLTSSSTKFGVNAESTSIPGCKKPLVLDVGVDKKKITNVESLDWRLDSNVNSSLSTCCSTGFHKVAWSPLNCDNNSRCVIAALFSEYHLCIYLSPTLGTKWKEAVDLSQVLCSYLTQNNFELRQDVMQETTQQNYVKHDTNKKTSGSSLYSCFKQRTQLLACTCLHWFSQLYHTGEDISSNEEDKKKFALLATGNQSGTVIFWKVTIPVILNTTAVQVGGFLNTEQSWLCSLSWQEITDNQGLLAVGSTDGLVKVFSLKVLPSIHGVAQYVLWGDKDDMQVQWLDWLYSPGSQANNRLHHLVVCKGPSVIVFAISVKDGILTQKPSHKIIQGVHRMPITGLACTHNGTIFTCSLDGSVQTSTADGKPATVVNYDVKKGFMCTGIGVSANAAFLALFLSPSNFTQQSLESHQIHIRFINIAWGSSSVGRLLNCKDVQLEKKWDVCKALQHHIYYSKNLPGELELASTEALESCSFAELVIRQHVLSVMLVITPQEDCSVPGVRDDWSAQLECTVHCMYKHLATATLNSWLEGREAGTVNHSDSVSALIVSDWLVMKCHDSAILDLVTKVYQACSDTEGLKKVSSLVEGNQPSVKAEPQAQTTIQEDSLQSISEAESELMDTDQTSAVVDVSVLEGECAESLVTLPIREKCTVCDTAIAMESLNYGTCLNGHRWSRCCVSFAVCADLAYRRCQDCNSCVLNPSIGSSRWLRGLLQSTSKCPFCLGFFR